MKRNKMNILISINSKFVMPAIVMLTSLFENNKVPIDVYMLYSSLNKNDIIKIKKCIKKYNNELFPIHVDKKLFKDAPVNRYISQETYYRLIAYKVLPIYLKKILYLDCDIIINRNIEAFYNQVFDRNYMIVCEEKSISKKDLTIYKNLNLPKKEKYFNAGVLVYNLELFRNNIDFDVIIKYISKNNCKLKWWDQDVLNALFYNRVKFADYKIYNLQPLFVKYNKKEIKFSYNNAAIIHFAGPIKPWNRNCDNIIFADLFWKYVNKTKYRYKNLNLQFKDYFYKFFNLL